MQRLDDSALCLNHSPTSSAGCQVGLEVCAAGFTLTAIITWVLRDYSADIFKHIRGLDNCLSLANSSGGGGIFDTGGCVGKGAVLRISFGNFLFFGALYFMVGVKYPAACDERNADQLTAGIGAFTSHDPISAYASCVCFDWHTSRCSFRVINRSPRRPTDCPASLISRRLPQVSMPLRCWVSSAQTMHGWASTRTVGRCKSSCGECWCSSVFSCLTASSQPMVRSPR